MSNASMVSTTSSQDLLTVRTKHFANKGMDYQQFAINLLVSAVLSSFKNPIHNNSP
jgi:predicted DNA binding CopG/RHH family protein